MPLPGDRDRDRYPMDEMNGKCRNLMSKHLNQVPTNLDSRPANRQWERGGFGCDSLYLTFYYLYFRLV